MLPYLVSALVAVVLVAAPENNSSTLLPAKLTSDLPTDATDKANDALENAARTFRIATYNSLREDRPEYNRRRAAWDQVHTAWVEAGRRPSDEPTLITWLETATQSAHAADRQLFPELPSFAQVAIDNTPKQTSEADVTNSNEGLPNTAPSPPVAANSAIRSNAVPAATNWWSGLGGEGSTLARTPTTGHAPSAAIAESPAVPARSATQNPLNVPAPSVAEPGNSNVKVRVTELPVQPQVISPTDTAFQAAVPAVGHTAGKVAPVGVISSNSAGSVPQRRAAATANSPDWISELPKVEGAPNGQTTQNAANSNLVKKPVVGVPNSNATGELPNDLAPSSATSGSPIDLRPRSNATSEPLPTTSSQPRTTFNNTSIAPVDPFVTELPQAPENAEVAVNLGELAARASGYQVALRTLNGVLQDEQILNIEQLNTLLGELEQMAAQRQTLLLYEKLISAEDSAKLRQGVQYPKQAIAQIGTRIANERVRLTAAENTSSLPEQQAQLRRLNELSQRLVKLSAE